MLDEYQAAIVNAPITQSIAVDATAGAGKSTVAIKRAQRFIAEGYKVLYMAFNKKIVEEIEQKFSHPLFTASTMNAYGNKYLPANIKSRKFNKDKWKIIFRQLFEIPLKDWESPILSKKEVEKIRSKFDFVTDEMFQNMFSDQWFSLTAKLGFENNSDLKELFNFIQANVEYRDFDDQIIFGQPKSEDFRLVIIDEAQDLTLDKLNLIERIMRVNKDAKILIIGDTNQTIYAWAGAKKGMIQISAEKFNCIYLQMNHTYRCPRSVVEIAKEFSPNISSGSDKEGEVIRISVDDISDNLREENLVLSRTTAKLIPVYFSLIRKKIPCLMKGKDMAKNVKKFTFKYKGEFWLRDFEEYILTVKRPDFRAMLFDLADCLKVLCEEMNTNDKDVVVNELANIFSESEENPVAILSTIHRVKGDENKNVIIVNHAELFQNGRDDDDERQVAFVAITRSKERLCLA